MFILLISGLMLVVIVAVISIAAAATIQVQERARRGALAPLGSETAGMLPAFSGMTAANAAQAPQQAEFAMARQTPALHTLDIDLTPGQRGAQIAHELPRINWHVLTKHAPIAHEVTCYTYGDDLFDVSYSLEDPSGEFVGEAGVSISKSLEAEGFKHVAAVEAWLFDKNDFRSPTVVLMSEQAYADEALRTSLEARGEPVKVEAGAMFGVVAETLQMQVIVADVTYKQGTADPDSVIETITLELGVWQHSGEPLEIKVPEPEAEEESGAESVEEPTPEAAPEPDTAEAEPVKDTPSGGRSTSPQVNEQKVRNSYTIDYTRRVYMNQPFTVMVNIPGLHTRSEPAAPVPSIVGMPKRPGELTFIHRWYPAYQDQAKANPGIRVDLKYNEDEFHVPVDRQTALLKEGNQLSFEFLVKPLKPDVLLLTVQLIYLGAKWVPERDTEILMTRIAETGKLKSVTTRRQPAQLSGDVRLLQAETLSVDVKSFLTLNSSELNAVSKVAGGIMTLAYVGWGLFDGQIADVGGAVVMLVGALTSIGFMVSAPGLVDRWHGRRR